MRGHTPPGEVMAIKKSLHKRVLGMPNDWRLALEDLVKNINDFREEGEPKTSVNGLIKEWIKEGLEANGYEVSEALQKGKFKRTKAYSKKLSEAQKKLWYTPEG